MKRKLLGLTIAFMAMSLANLVANATEVAIYDVDGNGTISMSDVVLLNRHIAEDLTTVYDGVSLKDINNDSMLTIDDSLELLAYIANMETQTTTTETTTTTTSTTTTTTQTSTTETTTTSTTTSSTTTETTTITTSESTETTTTTNTADLKLIQDVLCEMQESETIPTLNDSSLIRGDGVFFFEQDGTLFAYTMYTKNENAPTPLAMHTYHIDAVHIWKYEGDTQVDFTIPDTEGLTFEWEGKTYTYNLDDHIYEGEIESAADCMIRYSSSNYHEIGHYDYNLNGEIDTEDLKKMIYLFGNNLVELKRTDVEWIEYFSDVLDFETVWLNFDNFVIHFDNTFVEYSFICPPVAHPTLYSYCAYFQILPDSMYDELLTEFGEPESESGEYILYNLLDGWTTSDAVDDATYIYILPVDSSGDYICERLDLEY